MEYAHLINPVLHCNLINWLDLASPSPEGGFEEALAIGLKNIPTHGNSQLRQAAAESLAHLTCLDRFHAGDGGARRIWRGKPTQLDDCACQQVSIGKLHFTAADYEFLQRKLVSAGRSEENQSTLLSVSDGFLYSETVSTNLPTRIRVAHDATELRTAEWQTAAPLFEPHGIAKSPHEKAIVSLCHDIIHPNHDRDYRSLGLFSAHSLSNTGLALRIFDVLHSGSGDTILQINIVGSLEDGRNKGFIDLIAANGHMRWLKPGIETLPRDRTHWLEELSDFAAVHPWENLQVLYDEDKGNVDSTPRLTCRQCRRKEKGPLTP